jgi:hypothetical protein
MFQSVVSNKGLKPLVFKYLIFACLLTLFILPVIAQDAGLTVDASKAIGPINPFVYGVNYGPWAVVPVDLWPMVQESGVTYFRFPAGNWGDQNDISNAQLDFFMLQAHKWNAEPHVAVRLLGGTPEKAAALVHYANVEKGYNIRYWSIGNEPNLYKNYTVDQFNKDWRAIAEAMLKVDPKIILTGPEVSQYPPTTNSSDYQAPIREWVRQFLKANGDLVGLVSIHRYPFPVGTNMDAETEDQLRQNPDEWDTIIPDLHIVIKDATGHDLPVAVTEVNSNWNNGATAPNTFFHAIWWADVLGRLIRQQVQIVNYFALYTEGTNYGLLGRLDARSAYYVYQLYKQFGTQLLTSTSSEKQVSVTAATKEDGSLTLMIVNRSTDVKTMPLSIKGFTASGAAAVWLLDKDHKAVSVDSQDLSSGKVTLPAESVTLYIVPASK